MFNVLIQPSGHRFPVEDHETILQAALKHGHILPYSCREGVCGVCKGKVLEGRVDHGNYLSGVLTDTEKAAGVVLFCCASPLSNLVIECHELASAREIQVRTLPCRVQKMGRVAQDVMVLHLKLPDNERLQFLAGQYIEILPKDHRPRCFSLANPPDDDELLELHVRRVPGGTFTEHVFGEMKERDILRFRGPFGAFFLRENSDRPIIFVASGTGFAPIKAIIEHALHAGMNRTMHMYWGGRVPADLYMPDKAAEWEKHGIRFTPVLSEPREEDRWQGRTGFVHQAVMEDYGDLSGYEVYASGAPAMVEAARRDFTAQRGLPAEAFFSDAFTASPVA